ncbi:MAG TPA: pyridoxamine 5'-phosphate oxidase family protein [Thermoanaerobaculia bacterium]|nr:pyridoxamine 5'-phosphate oxidase family protein [Thermoanaerobaculia bacterium]
MTATIEMTERTRVRRLPKRGQYDAPTIHAILDEAMICHVGFVVDGAPVVIPTIHWRDGDTLYLHGSAASRMLRSLKNGVEACVTVTLLDGLVLARSAFHHSMNYRSVVVFGQAREVVDETEKVRALEVLVEHVVRGRSKDIRQPNDKELRQTLVLAMPLEEASAKIRTGGPVDDDEDYALPIWAGVLPLTLAPGEPIADTGVTADVPGYVKTYVR